MVKLIAFFVLITTTVFGFNDGDTLRGPAYGDATCTVLTPTVIELGYVTQFYPAADGIWNYGGGAPAPGKFSVTANGSPIPTAQVSFKRQPLFGYHCDGYNRGQPYGCIGNYLYLSLSQPIPDGAVVSVKNPDQSVFYVYNSTLQFATTNSTKRTSPVLHVNQNGYIEGQQKKAIIGYYCGTTMNELVVDSTLGFSLLNDATGAAVYTGQLTAHPDDPSNNGFTTWPKYQLVLEANFSSFDTPGTYRVYVPGLGVSLPFSIDASVASYYSRTFGLGMYHTRCGGSNSMPFTRFTKDACHTANVAIPPVFGSSGQANYSGIRTEDGDNINASVNPPNGSYGGQAGYAYANVLAGTSKSMSGGHHDAGDYGRYMHNSSMVSENLLFAVDVIDGVANIDNIGLPESGDGIPDLLQEAKWELDYIVNCQDSDGGVFCQINASDDRDWPYKAHPFECSQSLTHGNDGSSQVAFPKTRPVTADAVGALALGASSPAMKRYYPAAAAAYWAAAQLGWTWLQNHTLVQYTDHYGAWNGLNSADMQMAFAAAAMYAATGDNQYQTAMKQYCPVPGNTRKWTWIPACDQWGCAFRTYAFAAKAGRYTTGQDATYKTACQQELIAAADMIVGDVGLSAYGADINNAYKRPRNAGWQTLTDTLLDCAAGFQINPKQSYIDATLSALDYTMGCNPNNMTFITGCGRKRQQNTVCQYHENDGVWQDVRKLPPTGTPTGAWWAGFYADTWWYNHRDGNDTSDRVADNCVYPKAGSLGDGGVFPMYDIWWDAFNTGEEYVIQQLSDVYAASAWLQAYFGQTNNAWRGKALSINVHSCSAGQPVTFTPTVSGVSLANATIVWETGPQQTNGSLARMPSTLWQGGTLTYTPTNVGMQWLEVEASLPDGRRLFAVTNFSVSSGPPANSPPSASIVAPVNGATFTISSNATTTNVVLSAAVADSDGTLTRVVFSNGATPLSTNTLSGSSASPSFTFAARPGTYAITATAFDNSGASTASPATCFYVVKTNAAPPAPSGLAANPGPGNITLSWAAPPSALSYQVKRGTANSGPYATIGAGLTNTTFLDTTYSLGTTYYYVVSAANANGEGSNSTVVAATPATGLPDLVVTAVNWTPTTLVPGSNVVFSATVLNQGSAATPAGTLLGVGFKVDGAATVSWSASYTSSIAPGASVTLAADGGPAGNTWLAVAGIHTLLATVDDVNRITEGNENNNSFSATLNVSAPPTNSALVLYPSFNKVGGGFSVSWPAIPGKTYRLDYKNSFTDPLWTPLTVNSNAVGTSISITDSAPSTAQRFYRAVQLN